MNVNQASNTKKSFILRDSYGDKIGTVTLNKDKSNNFGNYSITFTTNPWKAFKSLFTGKSRSEERIEAVERFFLNEVGHMQKFDNVDKKLKDRVVSNILNNKSLSNKNSFWNLVQSGKSIDNTKFEQITKTRSITIKEYNKLSESEKKEPEIDNTKFEQITEVGSKTIKEYNQLPEDEKKELGFVKIIVDDEVDSMTMKEYDSLSEVKKQELGFVKVINDEEGGDESDSTYFLSMPPGVQFDLSEIKGNLFVNNIGSKAEVIFGKNNSQIVILNIEDEAKVDLSRVEKSIMIGEIESRAEVVFGKMTMESSVEIEIINSAAKVDLSLVEGTITIKEIEKGAEVTLGDGALTVNLPNNSLF